jgi:hypothetical protein
MTKLERIGDLVAAGAKAAPGLRPWFEMRLPFRVHTGSGAAIEFTSDTDGRKIRIPMSRGRWSVLETININPATRYIRVWSVTTGRPVIFAPSGRVPAKRLRTNR